VERKESLIFFDFSWSLKIKFLKLFSSYHNQVSDGERLLVQANYSTSCFGKAEEVTYVS